MKLRNKKTGDAVYVDFQIPLSNNNEVLGFYSVTSLKELNESFEDYKPKEPLIKDEKIRKAVRAWAEVDGIVAVEIVSKYQLISLDEQCSIEFFAEIYPEYAHNEEHTIAELCGDEEE